MATRTRRSNGCLGLFAKRPLPGVAKTRLVPRLGPEGAAQLYQAFVVDTLNLAMASNARHCRLFESGAVDAPPARRELAATLARLDRDPRFGRSSQSEGNLGDRLTAAFAEAAMRGELPLLILGTDSPDLPATALSDALAALDAGADVALGAASDGGVWCIGLGRAIEGFFADLPWSSPGTGDALRERARATGLESYEAPPWFDCDEPADLDRLAERLERAPASAPATRAWLDRNSDVLPPSPDPKRP